MFTHEVDPQLVGAAQSGPVDAIVFYKQANTPAVQDAVSALDTLDAMPLGAERKSVAYNAIHQLGEATLDGQMPALQQLVAQHKASGIDSLWSMNAVLVRGASLDTLRSLAGPDVEKIIPNSIVAAPVGEVQDVPDATAASKPGPQPAAAKNDTVHGAVLLPQGDVHTDGTSYPDYPEDPNAVYTDWGVRKMDAPAAWSQGITGAGVVFGSIDTGVITTHPGLKNQFRGTKPDGTVDYNYNYANFVENNTVIPVDDVGHGTHTVGTVCGNDGRHLTGVAPDAKFIVARALGEKGGSMFSLMKAMEWMMAPTDLNGKNPRPDLAPDLITNSWGGGATSNPFLWMELRNWRRAGIIPVFASGNDRTPKPGNVAAPGLYGDTITVGATDNKDARAFFSMYGPSEYATDHKPEIAAPGVKTYSTVADGSFSDTLIEDGHEYIWQGTSMATPHVSGAVALYLQAHPHAKFDDVLHALEQSGTLATNSNDEIGYGRVQVDKLIGAGSIDPSAKLTDPARVKQLMDEFNKSQDWQDPPKPDAPAAGTASAA
jgi:subtilisin family serine protease